MQEQELQIEDLGNMFKEAFKKAKEDYSAKLNVMVIGKTGVGKSSLINTIFGSEIVKAGSGEPVTKKIENIKINNNFSIYDTIGLELSENYHLIQDEIKNFLEKDKEKSPDNQIHIVWFCISENGRRIEEDEIKLVKFFEEKNYKTIIVITKIEKDTDNNGIKFSDLVKDKFEKDANEIQRVRAIKYIDDDGDEKDIKGINELINKTHKLLPKAQKSAFARHQIFNKELKKEEALKIINYYTAGAGVTATTPIPFSDIALLLPIQLAMIANIAYVYDIQINEESIKKIIVSSLGVVATGFAVRFAVGNLLKFIPVMGTIGGGALNATVAGSVTNIMGKAFIAYLDDNFDGIFDGSFDLISDFTADIFKKYLEAEKDK